MIDGYILVRCGSTLFYEKINCLYLEKGRVFVWFFMLGIH